MATATFAAAALAARDPRATGAGGTVGAGTAAGVAAGSQRSRPSTLVTAPVRPSAGFDSGAEGCALGGPALSWTEPRAVGPSRTNCGSGAASPGAASCGAARTSRGAAAAPVATCLVALPIWPDRASSAGVDRGAICATPPGGSKRGACAPPGAASASARTGSTRIIGSMSA